jgi:branched-chain amino acid transport system permease protein
MRRPPDWLVEAAVGAVLLSLALVAVGVWGFTADPARQGQIITFFQNAIIVLAVQVYSGNSGILSFGHLAFVGIGAYTAGILMIDPVLKGALTGLPAFLQSAELGFLPATLVAAAVVALVALFVGLPIVRLSGAAAVIAILSLVLIANVVFANWTGVTRGAGGLFGVPFATTVAWALVWAIVAVFAARLFKDSATGLQLQASREDELAAPSVGVPVRAVRLKAWVLSGALAGVAGAVLAGALGTVTPSSFFLQQTFFVIVMLVVGGMATVTGAVVGAGLITFVQEAVRGYEDRSVDLGPITFDRLTGLTQIVLVVLILLVMYLRPEGLVGRYELDETLRALVRRRRLPAAAPLEPASSGDLTRPDATVSDQVAKE